MCPCLQRPPAACRCATCLPQVWRRGGAGWHAAAAAAVRACGGGEHGLPHHRRLGSRRRQVHVLYVSVNGRAAGWHVAPLHVAPCCRTPGSSLESTAVGLVAITSCEFFAWLCTFAVLQQLAFPESNVRFRALCPHPLPVYRYRFIASLRDQNGRHYCGGTHVMPGVVITAGMHPT